MSVLSRWLERLRIRRELLVAARRRHEAHPTEETRRDLDKRKAQVLFAERVVARHRPKLTDTVPLNGAPLFRGLALMLEDASANGWSGQLVSGDRREGVAERYGKLSQAKLYAAWVAWSVRGVILPYMRGQRPNPANRPNQSTHELHSDGKAYRGPVGRPLAWWQLGLDVTEADELRRVLVRLGYQAFRPYPDGREAHHVNLRESPTAVLRRRGIA